MEAAALPLGAGRRRGPFVGLRRTLSDETLADRIRAGDDASFEVLYDRHHRGLLAFARHMLGDSSEAEDVLQHVFAQAYRTICADPRELHVKAWLYTVARNRCLSLLRKRRESPAELDERLPALDGLSAQVERRSELRELLVDLARVPDDQRAALVLSELGDLGHDDIAAVLGVRRDKVKALVFQAREHLMLNREARLTPCAEIQEELATLRGGQLRRGKVRRHVDQCDACKAFGAEVRRQRAAMALVLPVAPALSLKPSVLAATAGGGGVAAGGAILGAGVFGGVSAAIEGVAAKVLVAAVVATGTGAGGYAALDKLTQEPLVAGGPGRSEATPKPLTRLPAVAPTSLGRLTATPATASLAPPNRRSTALRDSSVAAPVAQRAPKASGPNRPPAAAPAPAAQAAPQAAVAPAPAHHPAPATVGHSPNAGGRNVSSGSGRSSGDTTATGRGRSGDSGQRSAPSRRSGGRKSAPQGGGQAKQGGGSNPSGAKAGGGGGAKAGGRQQRSGVRGGRSGAGRRTGRSGAAPAPAPTPVQPAPAAAAQPAAQPAPAESTGSGNAGRNDSDEGKPGRDGS